MKQTTYVDHIGRRFLTLIPDNAPDEHAQYGVLVGPPELDDIELPESLLVRLHNELYSRKIFTLSDVKKRRNEVMDAVRAVLRLDCEVIANSYYRWETESDG